MKAGPALQIVVYSLTSDNLPVELVHKLEQKIEEELEQYTEIAYTIVEE